MAKSKAEKARQDIDLAPVWPDPPVETAGQEVRTISGKFYREELARTGDPVDAWAASWLLAELTPTLSGIAPEVLSRLRSGDGAIAIELPAAARDILRARD